MRRRCELLEGAVDYPEDTFIGERHHTTVPIALQTMENDTELDTQPQISFFIQTTPDARLRYTADPKCSVWAFVWQFFLTEGYIRRATQKCSLSLEIPGVVRFEKVVVDLMHQQPQTSLEMLRVQDGDTLLLSKIRSSVDEPEWSNALLLDGSFQYEEGASEAGSVVIEEMEGGEDPKIVLSSSSLRELFGEDTGVEEQGNKTEDSDGYSPEEWGDYNNPGVASEDSDGYSPTPVPESPTPARAITKRKGKPQKYKRGVNDHLIKVWQRDQLYYCDFQSCKYKGRLWASMLHHFRSHEPSGKFFCPHAGCDAVFTLAEEYEVHTRDVHGSKRLPRRPESKKAGLDVEGMRQRKRSFSERDTESPRRVDLEEHPETHRLRNTRTWSCNYTGCTVKNFTSRDKMKEHLRSHKDVHKRYTCPSEDCKKSFERHTELMNHIVSSNHNVRSRKLSTSSTSSSSSTSTMTPVPEQDTRESTPGDPDTEHRCSYLNCYKTFPSETALQFHKILSHGEERRKIIARTEGVPESITIKVRDSTEVDGREKNYLVKTKTKLEKVIRRFSEEMEMPMLMDTSQFVYIARGERLELGTKTGKLGLRDGDVVQVVHIDDASDFE